MVLAQFSQLIARPHFTVFGRVADGVVRGGGAWQGGTFLELGHSMVGLRLCSCSRSV